VIKKERVRALLIALILLLAATATLLLHEENGKYKNEDSVAEKQGGNELLLSWWGNDDRHQYTMQGVDHFMEETPDINVTYRYGEWNGYEKRTGVWMRSKTEADVMQINYAWLDEYSKDGEGFYDLSELSDVISLDAFSEEQIELGTRNGHLNALPIAMNSHVFYYNREVLEAHGLSEPKTWSDLFDMGKTLKKDGIYLLGMSKKQLFIFLCAYYEQSYGKPVFAEDGSFTASEEEMAALLAFYKKMIDENVLCPIELFDKSDYLNGRIAGTMCWISDTGKYCDALEEKGARVSMCLYPMLPGAKLTGWYIKPATMWAISAQTKHPKEAAQLLEYLLNDPYMVSLQSTEKGVPVSSKAIATLSEEGYSEYNEFAATEMINENRAELKIIISNMEKEAIIDAFKEGADEYLFGRKSEEEAASQICTKIRQLD
jgi:oligogalacturonide transport system substrate-binding protein